MIQHTPTPWRVVRAKGYRIDDVVGAKDQLIASFDGEPFEREQANAAFIVRAANAHDALIAALQSLHDNIAEYARINNLAGFDNQDMQQARAALKLAGAPQSERPANTESLQEKTRPTSF